MADQWTYDGPDWIYLQPVDDAPPEGREWSSDAINVPTDDRQDQTEPTDCPYVRGDIHDAVVLKLAERDREVGESKARLSWLFQHCRNWQIGATHNTHTGFFISRIRSTGWCGGEERWEDERIAWAPPNESFASAIDRAISGEDPNAEILGDIRRRKAARQALTPEPKPEGESSE